MAAPTLTEPVRRAMKKWGYWLILAMAAGLRLFRLGAADFWYDEAFSAVAARQSFPVMLRALAGDVHPPLWYVLMWGWLRFTGVDATNEAVLRLPSAVLSWLAVPMVWHLARMWRAPSWTRWAVALWVAISPAQIHYAQEFRMYAFFQAEFLALLLLFYAGHDKWAAVILYVMLLTHHYGMFYAAAIGLMVVLEQRTAYPYAVAIIAWSPWAALLWVQAQFIHGHYWIQPFHPVGDPLYTMARMMLGWALPPWAVVLAAGVLSAAIMVGIWWNPSRRWWWVGVPVIAAAVASIVWQPVWLPRAFLPVMPVVSILTMMGWRGGARWYFPTMFAVFWGLAMWGYYSHMAVQKGDFSHRVAEFADSVHPDEDTLFVHTTDATAVGFSLYAQEWRSVRLRVCEDPPGALSPMTRSALFPITDEMPGGDVWLVHTESPLTPPCLLDQAQRWEENARERVPIAQERGGRAIALRLEP